MCTYHDHSRRKTGSFPNLQIEQFRLMMTEETHIVAFFATKFTVFALDTFPGVGAKLIADLGEFHATWVAWSVRKTMKSLNVMKAGNRGHIPLRPHSLQVTMGSGSPTLFFASLP